MELFKISDGPWQRMFEGKFQEMDVEIYINTESVILILIFEKEGDEVKGAIVELYKVFYSVGETETFTETLPREVILLTKHDEKETMRFFMLGSKPNYVDWKENEFIKEVDTHLKRLKTSSEMIKDVSKAYELTLKEVQECPDHIKEAFFSQPLLIPITSTSSHFSVSEGTLSEIPKSLTKGEIILGLTKDKKRVIEPLALFTKLAVTEGKKEERRHVMHIIAESCLLSGITPIILDWHNEYLGLHEASKDEEKLQKYKVGAEPIGFPVKVFSLGKELVIDLSVTNPKGFVNTFGIGSNKSAESIIAIMQNEKPTGLKDLIDKTSKIQPDESLSIYEIYRTQRILKLIDSMYEGLFEGKNNMEDISKSSSGKIGRASVLNLKGTDERTAKLVVQNIFNGMLAYYTEKGSSSLKSILIWPSADSLLATKEESILANDISQIIPKLNDYGIGFCLEIPDFVDTKEDVKQSIETRINIVKDNDVGVQLKGRKSYRVFVRPGLSKISESTS